MGLYLDEKNSRSSASSLNSSRVQKERGRKPYLIALDTIDCLCVPFIGFKVRGSRVVVCSYRR